MHRLRDTLTTLLAMSPLVLDHVAGQQLAALPDSHGFAGAFTGVAGGHLLVAGGANFPDAPLAEGGVKVWHDRIFALEAPDQTWRLAGKLPRPLGYGVSVDTADGVLCIGGSDAKGHHRDCFTVRLQDGRVDILPMPALPVALANMAGARLGNTVFIVGGTLTPTDTTASRDLFSLDLEQPGDGWKRLDPIPGPGRILPVVAACEGGFHVVSGASLAPDAAGKPVRTYLKDGWVYRPGKGWSALPDLPRAVVAAPSPAMVLPNGTFRIFGGDDGSLAGLKPGTPHPGFSRRVLEYHTTRRTWSESADLPAALTPAVTAPTCVWRERHIVASGEARPGIRTPQMMTMPLATP